MTDTEKRAPVRGRDQPVPRRLSPDLAGGPRRRPATRVWRRRCDVDVSRLWSPVTRWGEFRRRQLAALEESNRIAAQVHDGDAADAARRRARAPDQRGRRAAGSPGPPAAAARRPRDRRVPRREAGPAAALGPGTHLRHRRAAAQPALAVLHRLLRRHRRAARRSACGSLVGRLTTTLTLLIVSMFLALALNPLVDALGARGMRRSAGRRGRVRRPARRLRADRRPRHPAGGRGGRRAGPADARPTSRTSSAARWVREIDKSYDVIDKVRDELAGPDDRPAVPRGRARRHPRRGPRGAQRRLPGLHRARADPVLPRPRSPASSTPPTRMVPATRRIRVESLSEEIMRRTGSYAIGQVVIATLNARAVVGHDAHRRHPLRRGARRHRRPARADPDDRRHARRRRRLHRRVLRRAEEGAHRARSTTSSTSSSRTTSSPRGSCSTRCRCPVRSRSSPRSPGAALLGVLGALLAIPVAAGLLLLYEEVLVPRQRRV